MPEASVIYRSGHIITYRYTDNPNYQFEDSDRRKKRVYRMTFGYYIKLLNTFLKLDEIKKHNLVFLTLTFPCKITHAEGNKIFGNFIDNFRKVYNLNAYACIAEYQFKNKTYENNIHYHLLADYPYISIGQINSAWINAINNFVRQANPFHQAVAAKNAVRLPPKRKNNWQNIVTDVNQLAKYLAKYLSKGKGTTYETKFFFASKNCRVTRGEIINLREIRHLINNKITFNRTYDYNNLMQVDQKTAQYIIHSYSDMLT